MASQHLDKVIPGAIDRLCGIGTNDRIGISLETVIDRTDFGITWNMELPSGGAVLENEVKLTADLELVKG